MRARAIFVAAGIFRPADSGRTEYVLRVAMASRYEDEEYLEQDEDEREAAGRRTKLVVLAVMAGLVVSGLFLVHRLREASIVEDCLMTRATNCNDLVQPPIPAGGAPSTRR
jgi:hypothetical protein